MATSKRAIQLPAAATGPESHDATQDRAIRRVTGTCALTLHGQNLTRDQIDLIKRTMCRGATDDELALFVTVANRTGLDPFSRQIHAVKRWDSRDKREVMSIQTGIDGYRLVAQRSGKYGGSDDPVFDTEEGEHPNKATATVYLVLNGVRYQVTRSARWSEFAQTYRDRETREERLTPLWRRMPWLMLGKCAEAQALRAAFPQELSGIYTVEEMGQADNGQSVEAVEVTGAVVSRAREGAAEEAGLKDGLLSSPAETAGTTPTSTAGEPGTVPTPHEQADYLRRHRDQDLVRQTRRNLFGAKTPLTEAEVAKLAEAVRKHEPPTELVPPGREPGDEDDLPNPLE